MRDLVAARRIALALLILSAALVRPPAVDAQLNVTGQWSTMSSLAPVQPIHVALMRTGKVLMIEGSSNDSTQNVYRYAIWDPSTGSFTTGTTPWDLFCNSMSFFPDGRLLISGGNLSYNPYTGLKTTTIFDPATEKFIQVEDMAKGRWYPTTVMLKDGGVMTFSGLDENAVINPQTEIYDVGHGWAGPYTAPFGPKYYPRLHLLTNGLVLMTGPSAATRTFDPATGTWSAVITNHPNIDQSRMYGTSVMLPLRPEDGYAARLFVTGGNTSTPYAGAHILDTSAPTWSWRAVASLDQPRVTHNAVLLPNGKVLVVGGSSTFNEPTTAAMNALLFDPATEGWGPAGKIAFPRLYHSTAILLPDGTVWLGGTNTSEGVWEPKMEIYKPPYLFTSTGAAAPRPTISSSPGVVGYAASFTVGTPQAASISQVVLARLGSATHAFDMEQRIVSMQFTKGSGTLTVTSPPSALIAPPGYYMLFVLDQAGVPSVSKFIRIVENPTNQPPVAAITSPSSSTVSIQTGQSVTFGASASDPDGSVATYQWLFPGGSPGKSTVLNPGAVTFSTPGTYTASLTVLDDLGENNPSPPTVTVVVGGAAALGAAFTSPPSGATISGTAAVSMSATNVQGAPTSFVLALDNGTTLSTQTVSGSAATFSWDTSAVTNGAHTLTLTVTDGAGRTAQTSIPVTVSNTSSGGGTGGGSSPPTVSITSPASGVWTGNSIGISVSAADDVGVTSVKLWGNGAVFATIPCSGTSCSGKVWWVTGSLPSAAYEVNAVATDTDGAQTVSPTITIYKSATSPVVASGASGAAPAPALSAAITSPASGATVNGTVAVAMSASNVQGSSTSFVLTLDGSTTLSSQTVSGSTASFGWNTIAVANGAHTLNLTVTDGAGRSTTASLPVTVSNSSGAADTTPPTVAITSPPDGAWTGNSLKVTVNGTDGTGLAGLEVYGNGTLVGTLPCNAETACTGSLWWATASLPSGKHTITAVAEDTAKNRTTSAPIVINK